METLRQYVLSVFAISLLGGMVSLFFRGGPNEAAAKLVTGLMAAMIVVAPLLKNHDLSLPEFLGDITMERSWAIQEGEDAAHDTASAYIKESVESYISNKAKELGVQITADVKLQKDNIQRPEEVTLIGEISPYVKSRLSGIICSELGVSEENQIWISRN